MNVSLMSEPVLRFGDSFVTLGQALLGTAAAAFVLLIALSAAFFVWLCLDLGLLTASLNY